MLYDPFRQAHRWVLCLTRVTKYSGNEKVASQLPLSFSFWVQLHVRTLQNLLADPWLKVKGCEQDNERVCEDYKDYFHYPNSQNHTWSNNNTSGQEAHLLLPSCSCSPKKDKKISNCKVKKSETGIAKLFKTLRKEGGFRRKSSAQDLGIKDHHHSLERKKKPETHRGSLDVKDLCRAQSMERQADRFQHDNYSPEQDSHALDYVLNQHTRYVSVTQSKLLGRSF